MKGDKVEMPEPRGACQRLTILLVVGIVRLARGLVGQKFANESTLVRYQILKDIII